jgi:hypothetical protein
VKCPECYDKNPDRAYQEQDYLMSLLKVEPYLDIVHKDPRFKAMMKKMNLE